MPVGCAKFDVNRCNESPLRGENPDFWPVIKFNTGILPLGGILPVKKLYKHHIFALTAGARSTIFPKLCEMIQDVETIKKVPVICYPTHSFSFRVQQQFQGK